MEKRVSRREFLINIASFMAYPFYRMFESLLNYKPCFYRKPTEKGKEFLKNHIVYSGNERKPEITITYDDQPYDPENIKIILNSYKKFDSQATFFLIMERVFYQKNYKK